MAGKAAKPRKKTKNEKRRERQKAAKAAALAASEAKTSEPAATNGKAVVVAEPEAPTVLVEYVAASVDELENPESHHPNFAEFSKVFEAFHKPEDLCKEPEKKEKQPKKKKEEAKADDEEDDDDEPEEKKLSKRQRKLLNRLSVAELKQLVKRPDVVEVHDVTSSDPRLLVYLKSYRNTVPVPRHWCHKRKYLQGKRGIEKAPFELPDFIKETGIEKIRATVQEKDDQKKMRARARERMAPKMGKIDIDYQVLYNAFFKFQTKPKLSTHGDLYFESKEFEVKLREKKPGVLSEDMKVALGMPEGSPPPWLINMQRYGPPPSYPKLKIPGLNAPIPPGASFGYHPGGWGKPPVDEVGRPLYGDVFGSAEDALKHETPVDKTRWGVIEKTEVSSEEEEEEEEDADMDDMTGIETPLDETGISSVTSGLETPDTIDLRKGTRSLSSMGGGETPSTPQLYKVLEQKEAGVGAAIYGSDKRYVVPTAGVHSASKAPKNVVGQVDVALDPSELADMDEDQLKAKYDAAELAKEGGDGRKSVKRKSRFEQGHSKKHKDFKF